VVAVVDCYCCLSFVDSCSLVADSALVVVVVVVAAAVVAVAVVVLDAPFLEVD